MNKERLLNVAKALRESPNPEQFSMKRHVNTCGTPACAFGHYAARADLQSEFSINTAEDPMRFECDGVYRLANGEAIPTGYDMREVREHFGLTPVQIDDLFCSSGCDGAKTPIEAAEYIERFVAEQG